LAAQKNIMAAKKQKFYVIWVGAKTGVFDNWDTAKAQIQGFPDAKYKSFDSKAEADKAFAGKYWDFLDFSKKNTPSVKTPTKVSKSAIIQESLSVDAACSGNPGLMEYRGVYTRTGQQLFHQGPFPQGTNNIGEFLALVHGLAYLKREGKPNLPIYSDSKTGISWVTKKKVKTELARTSRNEKIFDLIERALIWLDNNPYDNPILKWDTENWGEIPADFGRK
jgi:ribonuclease HI